MTDRGPWGEGARLAIDIGGTFTDVALEVGPELTTTKVLTTHEAPAEGVLEGVRKVMSLSGTDVSQVQLVIHGTTLATNAIIERKGARTALLVTEGHRDALEMAHENRFEQYDIGVDRPLPLVPRHLRLPVRERTDKNGNVLIPMDEDTVTGHLEELDRNGIEAVAVGLIHGYANDLHEQRIREILRAHRPDLAITLASEVCPEVREYERLSTACANAYVQPLMSGYLRALASALEGEGLACPFLLMTSGGGLTTLDTAVAFPIRLVESGPAGGAILASHIARESGLERVVSVDMGGTTAKLCLIDQGRPINSRHFEVARSYRFKKGSGLPVRIPVIEMVEIGAGGGSIASVDALRRIQVGPESAGSEPGPAAYARGGTAPTVTDADVTLGRLDPDRFAGGAIDLVPELAEETIEREVGGPLGLEVTLAAFGISEVVDENMANAARTHAIEWGKGLQGRTMIAFGGSAPLHAARLAEKLDLERVIVPRHAGVGSALGFLLAPISFEVVRSRYMRLSAFDGELVEDVLEEMRREAEAVVAQAAPRASTHEVAHAYMRYVGQGHEIGVRFPEDPRELHQAFTEAYAGFYGRTIPKLDIEVLSWTLVVSTDGAPVRRAMAAEVPLHDAVATAQTEVFEQAQGRTAPASLYSREELAPGGRVIGPALIAEDQTTSVVPTGFVAWVTEEGHVVLEREAGEAATEEAE